MEIAYCVAMVFIFIKVCLIVLLEILSLSSRIFMEVICVVALARVVMIMKDLLSIYCLQGCLLIVDIF